MLGHDEFMPVISSMLTVNEFDIDILLHLLNAPPCHFDYKGIEILIACTFRTHHVCSDTDPPKSGAMCTAAYDFELPGLSVADYTIAIHMHDNE